MAHLGAPVLGASITPPAVSPGLGLRTSQQESQVQMQGRRGGAPSWSHKKARLPLQTDPLLPGPLPESPHWCVYRRAQEGSTEQKHYFSKLNGLPVPVTMGEMVGIPQGPKQTKIYPS